MRRNFTYKKSWVIIIAVAIFMNFAFSNAMSYQRTDTSILKMLKPRSTKTPLFKSTLHLVLPPIKPAVISTTKLSVAKPDDKLLSNVQVYPNPVTDQINLKYEISRPSGVNIKIMDVLGNEIFTLFNQRIDPGEKSFNYSITNKLNRGFYFIRIVAGTESIIKRISVIPN